MKIAPRTKIVVEHREHHKFQWTRSINEKLFRFELVYDFKEFKMRYKVIRINYRTNRVIHEFTIDWPEDENW